MRQGRPVVPQCHVMSKVPERNAPRRRCVPWIIARMVRVFQRWIGVQGMECAPRSYPTGGHFTFPRSRPTCRTGLPATPSASGSRPRAGSRSGRGRCSADPRCEQQRRRSAEQLGQRADEADRAAASDRHRVTADPASAPPGPPRRPAIWVGHPHLHRAARRRHRHGHAHGGSASTASTAPEPRRVLVRHNPGSLRSPTPSAAPGSTPLDRTGLLCDHGERRPPPGCSNGW